MSIQSNINNMISTAAFLGSQSSWVKDMAAQNAARRQFNKYESEREKVKAFAKNKKDEDPNSEAAKEASNLAKAFNKAADEGMAEIIRSNPRFAAKEGMRRIDKREADRKANPSQGSPTPEEPEETPIEEPPHDEDSIRAEQAYYDSQRLQEERLLGEEANQTALSRSTAQSFQRENVLQRRKLLEEMKINRI